MPKTKSFFLVTALLLFFSWFTFSSVDKSVEAINSRSKKEKKSVNAIVEKLKQKSADAISFAAKNGYNTSVCFLIDMSLPSGGDRFFVYDMSTDSIQNS